MRAARGHDEDATFTQQQDAKTCAPPARGRIDTESAAMARTGSDAAAERREARIQIFQAAMGALRGLSTRSTSRLRLSDGPADGRHGREPGKDQTARPERRPYQRKQVVLATAQPNGFASQLALATGTAGAAQTPGGVQAVGIVTDTTAPRQVYDPGHPDADAQGYVAMPNVNPVTEMVDLIASSRSYEANVTALQTAKSMFSKAFDLLR